MMGYTTLREIREALAAARSGETTTPPASTPADELESLSRLLEGENSQILSAPTAKASAEVPHEGPNPALQQTGGA